MSSSITAYGSADQSTPGMPAHAAMPGLPSFYIPLPGIMGH